MKKTDSLGKRQAEILTFLGDFAKKTGYPPSVREIGNAVGLSSSSTVHTHLSQLEVKGYIRRDGSGARAIIILKDEHGNPVAPEVFSQKSAQIVNLPVVGRVAAGEPILAEQNVEETVPMPSQIIGDQGSFMLTVRGESMIDAGILDGDYVVVREQNTANNGDIVVAMIDDEATVKTFYRENNRIRLQPQNSTMSPIYSSDVAILGKVIALLRAI
ncbi:MAG: transcriptional repressor LexA [Coriobacteriales bacterium]|jgi:repressor LexA|nr:transcriptional repressor LexA [Coriobacteriales bacterium]